MNSKQRKLNLSGYVGFDLIAQQYVNKLIRDGFSFNIICVGETGIGKTTLVESLFNIEIKSRETADHNEECVRLSVHKHYFKEKNINLKLSIIETIGFGDQVNKENCYDVIRKYIDNQFEINLQNELSLNRQFKQINDTLVHMCLYFVSPIGHGLKPIDLLCLKMLDKRVNIVPIIAKPDTLTKQELIELKSKLKQQFLQNDINLYKFPTDTYDCDVNSRNTELNEQIPLAAIASNDRIKFGDRTIRGRKYKWGIVNIENESHCDFAKLREVLLTINMIDLIETTHSKHHELYRTGRLKELEFDDNDDNIHLKPITLIDVYNKRLDEFIAEVQLKDTELKEGFIKKIRIQEAELKSLEAALQDKRDAMIKSNDEQRKELEEKRKKFQLEMQEFRIRKIMFEQSKSKLNLKKK